MGLNVFHPLCSESIRKMLLSLLYVVFLIQKSGNVLLNQVTSESFIENHINQVLANQTSILLVNSNIRLSAPTMYFNSPLPNLYELTQFNDLYIVLNCTEIQNITKLLNQFVEHVGLLDKANTMILVPEKPDKSTMEFLAQNEIHKVVFINLKDVEFLYIQSRIVKSSKEFPGWPKSPRSFKACYIETVPYTALDHNKKGLFLNYVVFF